MQEKRMIEKSFPGHDPVSFLCYLFYLLRQENKETEK